ncbi:MAG: hypothetical protein IKS20_10780, partial [Victivallales bacterium]|nr:hypothetical protein [Victivallales bacterium]
RYIAGINPVAPGFKSILLRPSVQCQAVPAFTCTHIAPAGTIESTVTKAGSGRIFRCRIPKGVCATLKLPGVAPQLLDDELFECQLP